MITIVGVEKLDYNNKAGKHVTGVKVHYLDKQHEKTNVEGVVSAYEWLNPLTYQSILESLKVTSLVGLEGDFNYRKNGNYVNVSGFLKKMGN